MADPNTRQGKRTPVTLKIKFKSETLEQFIERYAVDVSQGGIFIRTKEPLAVGTQMKFEFQLRDASPLIAGEGTVVWTRENDPSRPAIAPGMGVRFDKLADGSQAVLEKILAEKAKQAPSRSQNETAPGQKPGGAFTDVPTKVAPAPVQEALGLRSRDSEQTPLPRPMPFHGDAEDFDEKAFDEATKVRSLDDLAAESARAGGEDEDDGSGLSDNPKNATVLMPADELAVRRRVTAEREVPAEALQEIKAIENVRRSGQIPVIDTPRTKSGPINVPDRDSAPALPSPPAVDSGARAPRVSDAPANKPAASEPAMLAGSDAAESAAPARVDSAAPRSVAAEPSRPSVPARPSIMPIVLGIVLLVGAAGAAVWYFVLRDKGQPAATVTPQKPDTGSAVVPDKGSNMMANPDTGSAGSAAMPATGSASGSGSAATKLAGSNAGSAAPSAPTVDTVITATGAKGATIEIVGTDQKGTSPFTAKLEKDKPYKAHVTAPFFSAADIDVKGGANATAKLVPDPHTLTVTTDPPGAEIYIDNADTGKLTPSDVTLTAAQAAKPRIHVTLRRAGFRPVDQLLESTAFKDDGSKATATVNAKLQAQQQVVRPPNNGGGNTTGSGATPAGSGAGSSTGGGTEGGDTGSASAPPPPPPPPAPASGSGSGGQVLK